MPVHDWTRVDAGIFHAFHFGWLTHLSEALNGGLLPEGFYALAEQHAGRTIPDILTLHASAPSLAPLPFRAPTVAERRWPRRAPRCATMNRSNRSRKASGELWPFAMSAAIG